MSKQVRITQDAKEKLEALVVMANEHKQDHEPKFTSEQYLSGLILDVWENLTWGKK